MNERYVVYLKGLPHTYTAKTQKEAQDVITQLIAEGQAKYGECTVFKESLPYVPGATDEQSQKAAKEYHKKEGF